MARAEPVTTPAAAHPIAVQNHRFSKGISGRFSLILLAAMSVLLVAFGIFAIYLSTNRAQDALESRLQSYLDLAEEGLRVPIWNYDTESANGFIRAVMRDENMLAIEIRSAGNTLAEIRRERVKDLLMEEIAVLPNTMTSFVPIITEGQSIATVHMSMSTDVVRTIGRRSGLAILGLAALLLTTVAALSILLLRRLVTQPMAKLQHSASIIADGKLDAPIELSREDEIGALARGFDTMRQALQRFVGALQAANESLEHRVQERTQELTENQAKLSEANQLVFDSIHYASRIQTAVLPPTHALETVVAEHFLKWEPRDVVGGDFYWVKEVEHGAYIVVGDCTGHGVPGAFMTLIVCGMLDRIFAERTPPKPSAVLEQLNIGMKELLGQDGKKGGTDDGLEAGVCFIDRSRNEILYAGARFSLWQIEAGESTEIKGAKAGLGHRRSPRTARFSDTILPFSNDTRFYLATDGLIDQVGGPKRRSFGKRRMLALLTSIYDQPMEEQAGVLQRHLAEFQGSELRRDDMTMLGFRPGTKP